MISKEAQKAGGGEKPTSTKTPKYHGKRSDMPAQKTNAPKKTKGVAPGVE